MSEQTMSPEESRAWAEMRHSCPRCHGVGYIVIAGEFGTSGAYPCSHRAESIEDSRMGVRIAPSVARHYTQEAAGAIERQNWWNGSRVNPVNRQKGQK